MAKSSKETTAENYTNDGSSFIPAGETVEQALGFPAYWKPEDEANANGNFGIFYATLVGEDISDPDFERWIFQAKHTLRCWRGPVNAQEAVIVKEGQFFSLSKYVQLRLQPYVGLPVQLTAVRKDDIGKGQTMWVFRLDTDRETAKILTERRTALVKAKNSDNAST